MSYTFEMGQDGILRATFLFGATGSELESQWQEVEAFSREAREAGKPLHVLVDARQGGKPSTQDRKRILALERANPDGRVAIFGLSRYVRVLVMFINKATGRDHVRYFGSEEEALAWLNAEKMQQ